MQICCEQNMPKKVVSYYSFQLFAFVCTNVRHRVLDDRVNDFLFKKNESGVMNAFLSLFCVCSSRIVCILKWKLDGPEIKL
jgi:hypothetical protein